MFWGLIPQYIYIMAMRKKSWFYNFILFLMSVSLNYLSLSFCYTEWWEIPELESENLLVLYDSLQMNAVIMEKIKNVDVSYLFCQYDIVRMQFRYGLNYETARVLYQYHMYHNVRVGSIKYLIEYADLFTEVEPKNYEGKFPKEWSELSPYQKQYARIGLMVFIGYWFIICVGSIVITPPKK